MNAKAVARFVLTALVVGVAAYLGYRVWLNYMDGAWTRDGRVRADVVQITADVSGRVVQVPVHDNQLVQPGEVLFIVDPDRYQMAVNQARAALEAATAQWFMRESQARRRAKLNPDVVSQENNHDTQQAAVVAKARRDEARAALDLAELNLRRATVRAPVAGYVTNFLLRPGDYAAAGVPKMALVAAHSFWVYGYFEETRLRHVRVGDAAQVTLMGYTQPINGRVVSMAYAIADRDNPVSADLTTNVNPVFNWVRLASRIPVRIALDNVPADVHLAAGMTCTVVVTPRHSGL